MHKILQRKLKDFGSEAVFTIADMFHRIKKIIGLFPPQITDTIELQKMSALF